METYFTRIIFNLPLFVILRFISDIVSVSLYIFVLPKLNPHILLIVLLSSKRRINSSGVLFKFFKFLKYIPTIICVVVNISHINKLFPNSNLSHDGIIIWVFCCMRAFMNIDNYCPVEVILKFTNFRVRSNPSWN